MPVAAPALADAVLARRPALADSFSLMLPGKHGRVAAAVCIRAGRATVGRRGAVPARCRRTIGTAAAAQRFRRFPVRPAFHRRTAAPLRHLPVRRGLHPLRPGPGRRRGGVCAGVPEGPVRAAPGTLRTDAAPAAGAGQGAAVAGGRPGARAASPGFVPERLSFRDAGDANARVEISGQPPQRRLTTLAGVAMEAATGQVLRVLAPQTRSPGVAALRGLQALHLNVWALPAKA